MLIEFCKSKISHARVTQTELHYDGSITIDQSLLDAADILPGEKVQIVNLNNGVRLETYVIAGEKGSGAICLNGPAARLAYVGDPVHIISYCFLEKEKAVGQSPKLIKLNEQNRITD